MSNLNLSEPQIRQIVQIVQKELDERFDVLINKRVPLPFSGSSVVSVLDVCELRANFARAVTDKLKQ